MLQDAVEVFLKFDFGSVITILSFRCSIWPHCTVHGHHCNHWMRMAGTRHPDHPFMLISDTMNLLPLDLTNARCKTCISSWAWCTNSSRPLGHLNKHWKESCQGELPWQQSGFLPSSKLLCLQFWFHMRLCFHCASLGKDLLEKKTLRMQNWFWMILSNFKANSDILWVSTFCKDAIRTQRVRSNMQPNIQAALKELLLIYWKLTTPKWKRLDSIKCCCQSQYTLRVLSKTGCNSISNCASTGMYSLHSTENDVDVLVRCTGQRLVHHESKDSLIGTVEASKWFDDAQPHRSDFGFPLGQIFRKLPAWHANTAKTNWLDFTCIQEILKQWHSDRNPQTMTPGMIRKSMEI